MPAGQFVRVPEICHFGPEQSEMVLPAAAVFGKYELSLIVFALRPVP
jgi:hypothetical protein